MTATSSRPRNCQFVCRRTGRERRIQREFGGSYTLPEVEVVQVLAVPEWHAYDDVAELDGAYYYLHRCEFEYDAESDLPAAVLIKEQYGEDYGGNVHRARTAPQSIAGISARVGALPMRSSSGPALFACVPPELPRLRREAAEKVERRTRAEELAAAYRNTLVAWQGAWDRLNAMMVEAGLDYWSARLLPEREAVNAAAERMFAARGVALEACRRAGLKLQE